MRNTVLYANAGLGRPDGRHPRGHRSPRNERVGLRRSLARELRAELAAL